MNILINTVNNFCLTFTKKFKFALFAITFAALASFTANRAMNELHLACKNGDVKKAEELLDSGKYGIEDTVIDGKYEGFTPLHLACHKEHKEIVQLLLDMKANIEVKVENKKDETDSKYRNSEKFYKSWTPLHFACKSGNKYRTGYAVIVELLLNKGANVDTIVTNGKYKGFMPIHLACADDKKKIIKLLLDKGANIDSIVTDGQWSGCKPIHLACIRGNKEIAELFLTDTNIDDTCTDGTYKGLTPLHIACKDGKEEVAKLLINKNANVNSVCITNKFINESFTPLHLACKGYNNKIAQLLLDKGAFVDTNSDNITIDDPFYKNLKPLHIAIIKQNHETIKLLLKYMANVNLTAHEDKTPLHFACEKYDIEAVKLLLENGSNPDAKNQYGKTPGQSTGYPKIIAILNLVSQFIKIQSKFNRDKFIKEEEKNQSDQDKLSPEFWEKVENANIRLGIIKPEPYKLTWKSDNISDSNVICEL